MSRENCPHCGQLMPRQSFAERVVAMVDRLNEENTRIAAPVLAGLLEAPVSQVSREVRKLVTMGRLYALETPSGMVRYDTLKVCRG